MLKRLKTYFHCFKCHGFRRCPIKYCPTGENIYMKSSIENGVFTLADPCKCMNPMKNL